MEITKRIILADDNSMHRMVLRSNLKTVGDELGIKFEILGEADDGEKLLALFQQAAPGSIDFVFSDIRMPNMDGLSALVKIRQAHSTQLMVMVSSEDMQRMDIANAAHGETARKTVEESQRMELLNKVAERIRKNVTEEGKTNSILTGCEKLALDPIWVAEQYGANGYLRKPYDHQKTKEIIQHLMSPNAKRFLAKT